MKDIEATEDHLIIIQYDDMTTTTKGFVWNTRALELDMHLFLSSADDL